MASRILVFFIFTLVLLVIIDVYLWWSLRKTINWTWMKWMIPLTSLLFLATFFYSFYRAGKGELNALYSLNFLVGLTFGVFIAKLLMITVFFGEDIVRVLTYFTEKSFSRKPVEMAGRREFVRNISLTLGAIPVLGTFWGITWGKYHFLVSRIDLYPDELPDEFDGLKIAHFTDFHAGSFDHPAEVKRGFEMLQAEQPDIIVFTGDAVNNRAEEFRPYVSMWKELHAPLGKYSILGNHDYGDYMPWKNEMEREENLNLLRLFHAKSGFHLLENEAVNLSRNEASISLLGVENWGKPPFPQYGNLEHTLAQVSESSTFRILLSHDPDHWEYQVREHQSPIQLTLSGHTHGAQFGVDIPGWKWSPVKYRYKRWLGLYEENHRYLYVNRGFGFLGFPGRVGMRPEIAVITLKKK
jgi:uncharacterized protein